MRVALRFVPILALAACVNASAAAPPIKLQGLPAAEFKKLPPDALLDVGGRTLTKSQFLSESSAKARQAESQRAAKGNLATAQAALAVEEKAANDDAASKVQAEWTNVAPSGNLPELEAGPRITSVGPLPIRSGHVMTVRGFGFGKEPGEVHLLGPFPGGHLTLPVCATGGWDITKCWWRPTAAGTVGSYWGQPTFTGIPDQQMRVVIVTKKGLRSEPFAVPFRAQRVLHRLKAAEVVPVRSDPLEGPCGPTTLPEIGDVTIACTEGASAIPTWHVGTDRVEASLKNGWTFDPRSSVTVWTQTASSAEQVLGSETGRLSFGGDRTTATATCDYASIGLFRICAVDLWAIGPEGIPWR